MAAMVARYAPKHADGAKWTAGNKTNDSTGVPQQSTHEPINILHNGLISTLQN